VVQFAVPSTDDQLNVRERLFPRFDSAGGECHGYFDGKAAQERRGFALRDALEKSQAHNGTYLVRALEKIPERCDRIIVVTDEQTHDHAPGPRGLGYFINVAGFKDGVGYGRWTHIDGWSEAVDDYIRSFEQVRAE
jgi:60 kDa SS-A/Ro ribonucleoprotein